MKRILFILSTIFILSTMLFSSCYSDEDLNEYTKQPPRQSEYFWYYDPFMFLGNDTVQLIGCLASKYDSEVHYVNRSCKVYNDTIYIKHKYIYPTHNIYKGIIRTNKQVYGVEITLQ